MKSPAALAAQRQMDEEIMVYVRESQRLAPVTHPAVLAFLVHSRRRQVDGAAVLDRLDDLVSRDCLEEQEDWVAGEGRVVSYRITHKGRQVLDGEVAPDA